MRQRPCQYGDICVDNITKIGIFFDWLVIYSNARVMGEVG
jgi:hypothetical protein